MIVLPVNNNPLSARLSQLLYMMSSVSDLLKELAVLKQLPESELLTRALENGLQNMFRDQICLEYLSGNITRQEAVQKVGIDWIELVEQKQQFLMEDVQKCLN